MGDARSLGPGVQLGRIRHSKRRDEATKFVRPGGLRARNTPVRRASLVLEVLEDAGGPHSAADAHGDHTVAGAATLHLTDEVYGQFGPRRPHGVTERDRAAVHVGLL